MEGAVRVMIVDDEPASLAVLCEVVEAAPGFEAVIAARSGDEALRRLADLPADLLLMDVRMPGTDGVATARAIARRPEHPAVILVSAEDRPDIAADPSAHGAVAFACKERVTTGLLQRAWNRLGEKT
jgi:CheY-like chemotaxis protein